MADRASPKRLRKILIAAALALVVLLAAGGFALWAATGGLAARPAGPALAAKQVLRIALVGRPYNATLDPALVTDPVSPQAIALAYTGLVKLDATTSQIVPDLATGWSISADGKTYTFHLRQGLKFSNGDPLTASDVAYSLDRAFSPAIDGRSGVASYYLGIDDVPNIVGALERAAGTSPTIIGTGVVVVNETTLQINLLHPASFFLAQLTTSAALVVDKKIIQQGGLDWSADYTAGSGPFVLKSHQPHVQLTFVPNPHWYGAKSHLTEIDMPIIADASDAFQSFLSNTIDIDNAVSPQNYLTAKSLGSKEFWESPALALYFLAPNDAMPPFNNVTVRQAFAEAVDRNAIGNQILGGAYSPTDHLVPLGEPGYDAGLQGLPFNPQDARAKLASVYPDLHKMPRVTLTYWSGGENEALANRLQQDFQTYLGVPIFLERDPEPLFDGYPRFQLSMSTWYVDYPDPQDWLSLQIDSGSQEYTTNFNNPQVNQLLAQADVERDQSKRLALYHQAEELAVKDVAVIPYAQGKNIVIFQKDVHGYTLEPDGLPSPDMWANVYICKGQC